MKCTQCGEEEFKKLDVFTRDGEKIVNIDTYFCINCGHVEWFVSQDEIKRLEEQEEKNAFGW